VEYRNIHKGIFLSRPNRFIAHVELNGETVICHVKNTGRCRELLVPGHTVYLEETDNPQRKTKYDLVAVEKGKLLINMDAQAPNRVFREWAEKGGLVAGLTLLRPETTWGNSRFDFYWEAMGGRRGFVEVKGVTLEQDGHALFPDAPTLRGIKHLEELAACQRDGFEACVCFVIQMAGMRDFAPNDLTHPEFGQALRLAARAGVNVMARECVVSPRTLQLAGEVPVQL
jgi:sugar fermentation stimulation protein A